MDYQRYLEASVWPRLQMAYTYIHQTPPVMWASHGIHGAFGFQVLPSFVRMPEDWKGRQLGGVGSWEVEAKLIPIPLSIPCGLRWTVMMESEDPLQGRED